MQDTTSSLETINWQEVPTEYWEAWEKTLKDSHAPFLYLSVPCPVCLSKTLYRWYMVGKPINPYVSGDGVKYIARGALWAWCSTCGTAAHYSANVPDFWKPPSEFKVDVTQLKSLPWPIEDARRQWEENH